MGMLQTIIQEMTDGDGACPTCCGSNNQPQLNQYLRRMSSEEEELVRTDADDELAYSGLIKYVMDNEDPSREGFERLAQGMSCSADDLMERLYDLTRSILTRMGKHNSVPDSDFDRDQLIKGIRAEMEHTRDKLVAKMIAKDHLVEIPDYYDRLEQMERSARVSDMDRAPGYGERGGY
jgi:hypothetical protein